MAVMWLVLSTLTAALAGVALALAAPTLPPLVSTASLAAPIALAAFLDRAVAEPPEWAHPVVLLGRAIDRIDRQWPNSRWVGLAVALLLPLGAGAVVALLVVGSWLTAIAVGLSAFGALAMATLAAGGILFTTISLRLLLRTARDVVELSASDPDRARRALRALVGREAGMLSPAQIRSAAVESAAENLADGLVAPLVAFVGGVFIGGAVVGSGLVGSLAGVEATSSPGTFLGASGRAVVVALLALGAGGAMWLKAVNTLDSMLGYPHKPTGWASAGLDDLAMWLPARVCAIVLALAAGNLRALVGAQGSAQLPASPNSGWPMATLATALGVELSKPDHYTLDCGPALPTVEDAQRGTRIVARAGWLSVAISALGAVLLGWLTLGVTWWP
jgi:adenosylcobinamide-phosphate synthase